MQDTLKQKIKLQQKKAKLSMEEVRFKIKERQMKTKQSIALGNLVVKAELDELSNNTLLGALLSIKKQLTDTPQIQELWTKTGSEMLNKDDENSKQAVILKLVTKPEESLKMHIRKHGLKWNKFRDEWYGYVHNIELLKDELGSIKYNIEIIPIE